MEYQNDSSADCSVWLPVLEYSIEEPHAQGKHDTIDFLSKSNLC